MQPTPIAYSSLRQEARLATIAIQIHVAAQVVGLCSGRLSLELIARPRLEATTIALAGFAGIVAAAALLISIIAFSVWLHRAYRNLSALGVPPLQATPSWAVGCFFVPIIGLWKPYRVMRELADCEVEDVHIASDGSRSLYRRSGAAGITIRATS